MKGTAVSSGVAVGKVRKISKLTDGAKLVEGEILLLKQADPSWSAIYEKASGIIMELGGALSHGAVIARELGKPAVAGLPGIFDYLNDGDSIGVDGLSGKIYIQRD